MKSRLQLAIQKKGRLSEKSIKLIRDCGIKFSVFNGQLKVACANYPLDIYFLRDDDIPEYVSEGIADIGIVGKNILEENESLVRVIKDLGFARCRLSIAVDRGFEYSGLKDLRGLNVATSYPNILTRYLEENGVKARIHKIRGSVEITPTIGVADAICDLVSTGSTLLSNGLREVEMVMESTALLVSTKDLSDEKIYQLGGLKQRIKSVLRAERNKLILLNAPVKSLDSICTLLPGMKSPTITPLKEKDWVSVQSVVREDQFWEIVDKLHSLGAEGILVMNLEKMVF